MKICIVDDNEIVRVALSESLQRFGPCTLCKDGDQALAAVRESLELGEPFALILMDIMMPGRNGLEVLKAIRALEADAGVGRRAKAFMLTAVSDGDKISEAYGAAGADAYLTKPVHTSELLTAMVDNRLIRADEL
ncbi:MAG: response regulator [Desulfovibrionaceae bacterium]|nr:response regulator [Desulfovibrionaceae bacterium]